MGGGGAGKNMTSVLSPEAGLFSAPEFSEYSRQGWWPTVLSVAYLRWICSLGVGWGSIVGVTAVEYVVEVSGFHKLGTTLGT